MALDTKTAMEMMQSRDDRISKLEADMAEWKAGVMEIRQIRMEELAKIKNR
jgi:hypothetical protein